MKPGLTAHRGQVVKGSSRAPKAGTAHNRDKGFRLELAKREQAKDDQGTMWEGSEARSRLEGLPGGTPLSRAEIEYIRSQPGGRLNALSLGVLSKVRKRMIKGNIDWRSFK